MVRVLWFWLIQVVLDYWALNGGELEVVVVFYFTIYNIQYFFYQIVLQCSNTVGRVTEVHMASKNWVFVCWC